MIFVCVQVNSRQLNLKRPISCQPPIGSSTSGIDNGPPLRKMISKRALLSRQPLSARTKSPAKSSKKSDHVKHISNDKCLTKTIDIPTPLIDDMDPSSQNSEKSETTQHRVNIVPTLPSATLTESKVPVSSNVNSVATIVYPSTSDQAQENTKVDANVRAE